MPIENIYQFLDTEENFLKHLRYKKTFMVKAKTCTLLQIARENWVLTWYIILLSQNTSGVRLKSTKAHIWHDSHSISISMCGVWSVRVKIQVFRKKLHTHIHLNYVRVEFLSCKKIYIYILRSKTQKSTSYRDNKSSQVTLLWVFIRCFS